jgi:hypothetical protein
MANAPVAYPGTRTNLSEHSPAAANRRADHRVVAPENLHRTTRIFALLLLAVALFAAPLLLAQATPRVTSADPTSGKVDDTVTLMGENLGKATVTGVFLSDDKDDFKATITDQGDGKIVMKVPKVKAGNYNVSVGTSGNIYIMPVRFTVQE